MRPGAAATGETPVVPVIPWSWWAAALACADGVAPRALDAARLVSTLRAQKVFLPS